MAAWTASTYLLRTTTTFRVEVRRLKVPSGLEAHTTPRRVKCYPTLPYATEKAASASHAWDHLPRSLVLARHPTTLSLTLLLGSWNLSWCGNTVILSVRGSCNNNAPPNECCIFTSAASILCHSIWILSGKCEEEVRADKSRGLGDRDRTGSRGEVISHARVHDVPQMHSDVGSLINLFVESKRDFDAIDEKKADCEGFVNKSHQEDVSKLMSLITADQKRGTDTNACIRHCAGIFLWPIRKKDAPAYQSCACAVRFSRHRGAWRASSDLERSMEHILMRAESLLAREPNARLSCI
ncbi:hypothetical protein U1Q18_044819 [Sarracenia purpurea var. burkii]